MTRRSWVSLVILAGAFAALAWGYAGVLYLGAR